ncbi:MAG: TlpA disulfide reductase family protein [Georgfuchsia sp.]
MFVALAAAWAGIELNRSTQMSDPESERVAAQLLAMSFTTPERQNKKLSDWQGKVLVVNFWATWCPPCLEEMPELSRAQDQYGPDGVQFVGIAIDETANVVEFSKNKPVIYPLLIAPPELPGLFAKLGNPQQGLPFTLIVGRDGKLRSSHLGRLTEEDLVKLLAPLL